jgi:predicted metal-dependent peptidase
MAVIFITILALSKCLRPKEVEFLFGHEVLHVVYDHFGRRGERDPHAVKRGWLITVSTVT